MIKAADIRKVEALLKEGHTHDEIRADHPELAHILDQVEFDVKKSAKEAPPAKPKPSGGASSRSHRPPKIA